MMIVADYVIQKLGGLVWGALQDSSIVILESHRASMIVGTENQNSRPFPAGNCRTKSILFASLTTVINTNHSYCKQLHTTVKLRVTVHMCMHVHVCALDTNSSCQHVFIA